MTLVALPNVPLSASLVDVSIYLGVSLLPLLAWRKSGKQKALRYAGYFSLGLLPILLLWLWTHHQNAVEVGGGKIHVQGAFFYEQARDLNDFDLAAARVVPGDARRDVGAGLRVSGISTPGLHAGTFRLDSGQPAFLLLIGDGPAVVLPAKVGPWLVVTVDDPQRFLELLRAAH